MSFTRENTKEVKSARCPSKNSNYRKRERKTFDLTVRKSGFTRSNVEVTTAEDVCRPRDLHNAIKHGIDKAKALKNEHEEAWREVSIGVKWKKGITNVGKNTRIEYKGDGTYHVYELVPNNGGFSLASPPEASGEDVSEENGGSAQRRKGKFVYLYKRDIVMDDFPHYLQRHRTACRWLDSVTIFTLDGDRSYSVVHNGKGWDVEMLDVPDAELHKRRLRRRLRRGHILAATRARGKLSVNVLVDRLALVTSRHARVVEGDEIPSARGGVYAGDSTVTNEASKRGGERFSKAENRRENDDEEGKGRRKHRNSNLANTLPANRMVATRSATLIRLDPRVVSEELQPPGRFAISSTPKHICRRVAGNMARTRNGMTE